MALTAPAIPAIAFALYQMQFATVMVALIFGSVRGRRRGKRGLSRGAAALTRSEFGLPAGH